MINLLDFYDTVVNQKCSDESKILNEKLVKIVMIYACTYLKLQAYSDWLLTRIWPKRIAH